MQGERWDCIPTHEYEDIGGEPMQIVVDSDNEQGSDPESDFSERELSLLPRDDKDGEAEEEHEDVRRSLVPSERKSLEGEHALALVGPDVVHITPSGSSVRQQGEIVPADEVPIADGAGCLRDANTTKAQV